MIFRMANPFESCKDDNDNIDVLNMTPEGRRGCDRMVVEFTNNCAINVYHH
jgi:hypothetical protein